MPTPLPTPATGPAGNVPQRNFSIPDLGKGQYRDGWQAFLDVYKGAAYCQNLLRGESVNYVHPDYIGPWESPLARVRHIAKTLTAVADLLDSYRPPTPN